MLFQKKVNKLKVTKILFGLFLALTVFFVSSSAFALQSYGDGVYGECKYSEGCDPAANSTVVTVPPTDTNPNEGRVFGVNLTEGQVIEPPVYKVRITPNFSADQIDRVALYLDGIEVGAAYQISGESFFIDWDVPESGNYSLTVKMFLKAGEAIEQNFKVSTVSGKVLTTKDNEDKSNIAVEKKSDGGLFQQISNFVDRLIESIPKPVAYLMPYGLILAIGLILLVLLIQTKNQFGYIFAMIELLKKDKLLFEEKATFIKLVSHHIRTPMTILKGGVEVYGFENPKVQLGVAMTSVQHLSQKTEELLSETQQNKQLQKISSPDIEKSIGLLYKSWKLIMPIALSLVLIVLLNYLFLNAGKTSLIIPNLIVQGILVIGAVAGLLVLLQRRKNNIMEQKHVERQHKYQLELDKARNNFIKQSASNITPLLIAAKQACQKTIPAISRKNIDEAFSRLGSLLERFNLASELERGKVEAAFTNVNPSELLESAFSVKSTEMQSKNLKSTLSGTQISLIQNEYLMLYILSALVDNAVGYADKGTKIETQIRSSNNGQVNISIMDRGLIIDEDKIESLFKPFSRSDDVVQFDKQGAGINLYLSKLISKYLGGDISLTSSSNKQTTATVSLPSRL